MKRLTKKAGKTYKYNFDTNCDFEIREQRSIETHNKIVDKLGQLEDNEEELGIDLNIKLKVELYYMRNYKNGSVYIYTKEGAKLPIYHFYPTAIKVLAGGDEFSIRELSYSDYGTTWALTKEELECQK